MKIGILQTAYKKSEDYGKFYNVQELGLARALAGKGHDVTLVKAVDGKSCDYSERLSAKKLSSEGVSSVGLSSAGVSSNKLSCDISGSDDPSPITLQIRLISVKYIGINGLLDISVLDSSWDALIYFCDTQLIVPSVYKWCRRNDVAFYPYIGVMESHSESGLKRELMDIISKRNLRVYKKCKTFAKTPQIRDFLVARGCTDVKLAAVGLDETVMSPDEFEDSCVSNSSEIASHTSNTITEELSSQESSLCKLLFIGRMEKEKHPLEMLTIFENLLDSNKFGEKSCEDSRETACKNAHENIYNSTDNMPSFSLTIIGDGYMYDEVSTAADLIRKKYNLPDDTLRLIRKVAYSDMHSYYKEADIYINLNLVEILGMSILEAMYYGCPVVAVDAPGPRFILDDEYGIIANDFEEITKKVEKLARDYNSYAFMTEQAFHHVKQEFTWNAIADKLCAEL